ncbi:unnamed protein product, partial [Didymodactylos carnosus]
FQLKLLDLLQRLPIKDRTTVIKNGIMEQIEKKIKMTKDVTDDDDDVGKVTGC